MLCFPRCKISLHTDTAARQWELNNRHGRPDRSDRNMTHSNNKSKKIKAQLLERKWEWAEAALSSCSRTVVITGHFEKDLILMKLRNRSRMWSGTYCRIQVMATINHVTVVHNERWTMFNHFFSNFPFEFLRFLHHSLHLSKHFQYRQPQFSSHLWIWGYIPSLKCPKFCQLGCTLLLVHLKN